MKYLVLLTLVGCASLSGTKHIPVKDKKHVRHKYASIADKRKRCLKELIAMDVEANKALGICTKLYRRG